MLRLAVANGLWRAFDIVFLLQMGNVYQVRFRDFSDAFMEEGLEAVKQWRKEQQEEWDRLTVTVSGMRHNFRSRYG